MPTVGPRERLLGSAIALVRQHGVEGMGMTALLAHSRTARGSIYQHFPGGKDELVEAATRQAGDLMGLRFVGGDERDPVELVRGLAADISRGLVADDFALGCPIVAAAVAGPEHVGAVTAAADVFAAWVAHLAEALVARGVEPKSAATFASLAVSALEGALLRARAARDPQPLDDAGDQLALLAGHLPRA